MPGAPADMEAAAKAAGIPVLGQEAFATHTHTELKVFVNGRQAVVPAGLGIDQTAGRIAALHTHDIDGILHVESPRTGDRFTLDQAIRLWGIEPDPAALCTATFKTPSCTLTLDGDEVTDADGLRTELKDKAVHELALTS